jgi:PAS domain S-box-containing protein
MVLGHSEFDFLEPYEALKIRQEDIELASSNLITDIPEERIESMTGEIKFGHKIKLAIPDADGKPSLILGLCQDLTEQKWAEQAMRASEIRFRELAEHAPVGIFMTDPHGAAVYINEQLQKMTGLDQEQAAGNGWIAAIHKEDRPKLMAAWQDFILGTSDFTGEFRFTHPDEHVIWVSSTAVRLKNESEQVIGFLGCVTDISLAKQHEIELRLSMNEAERANSAKSEFLSRMSHELRTPLNAVLGFAQLLQMTSENLTQSQEEGVNHILNGGEHLLHLIEDVLDFSRIESGHTSLNLQRFSLDQVLQRSLSLIRSLAEQRDITIISPANELVGLFADVRLTQQILVNLLTNAIKYNNIGGTVEVSASTLLDNMIRISIKDDGIGIRPDDQTRLFEPFERVVNPDIMIEGTGIGLSICKKLVQSMSGRIGFESEFGIGSTFWFELPAAIAIAQSSTGESDVAALTSELEGVRILYVEDHLASISLMTELARQIPDCDFTAVSNALDGVSLAKSSRPDLILMDINLPGLGGFEAMALIRKDERTRGIPVIALSASTSPELIESGKKAGFAHYLAKPLKLDSLLETLVATHKPSV